MSFIQPIWTCHLTKHEAHWTCEWRSWVSKSFDDTGLGPVSSTWKGICQEGTNFNVSNCDWKLIGARYFAKGYEAMVGPIDETKESKSTRDDDGHDTHTSTTTGAAVQGASLLGYASGVARGMATRARIAAYKVCWVSGCFSSDLLAPLEQVGGFFAWSMG
ncbi:hypothetical protein QQ045_011366 [Rhodiola kirilowii]